jgi:hypothetical protein
MCTKDLTIIYDLSKFNLKIQHNWKQGNNVIEIALVIDFVTTFIFSFFHVKP